MTNQEAIELQNRYVAMGVGASHQTFQIDPKDAKSWTMAFRHPTTGLTQGCDPVTKQPIMGPMPSSMHGAFRQFITTNLTAAELAMYNTWLATHH